MAFPTKLLNDNEEVVLDLRPHWWFLAGPVATLFVTVVLGIFVLNRYSDANGFGASFANLLSLIVVLVALVWMIGRYLKWSTTNFVITSDRLVFRHGEANRCSGRGLADASRSARDQELRRGDGLPKRNLGFRH